MDARVVDLTSCIAAADLLIAHGGVLAGSLRVKSLPNHKRLARYQCLGAGVAHAKTPATIQTSFRCLGRRLLNSQSLTLWTCVSCGVAPGHQVIPLVLSAAMWPATTAPVTRQAEGRAGSFRLVRAQRAIMHLRVLFALVEELIDDLVVRLRCNVLHVLLMMAFTLLNFFFILATVFR